MTDGLQNRRSPLLSFKSLGFKGLDGFEPSAYGLGIRVPTVHPVRDNAFSIGYDAPHSDASMQFVHQYAPYSAPRDSPTCTVQ
jgi:hypothetical protein